MRIIVEKLIQAEVGTVWADIYPYQIEANMHAAWGPHKDNVRPDIIIKHKDTGDMTLIELTCPFEWTEGINDAHKRKVAKYTPYVQAVRANEDNRHLKVSLLCIEVGSRGYVANTAIGLGPILNLDDKPLRQFLVQLGRTSFLQSLRILKNANQIRRTEDTGPLHV